MKLQYFVLVLLALLTEASASLAQTPPETYNFHIKMNVSYRCYGGYNPQKKVYDSRTHMLCDNKSVEKTLVDKTVSVKIVNEPTPDNSPELSGDAEEKIDFMGRKFIWALSLFKDFPDHKPPAYTLRLVTKDDEPTHRESAYYVHGDSNGNFMPTEIEYTSANQPEEISLTSYVEKSD